MMAKDTDQNSESIKLHSCDEDPTKALPSSRLKCKLQEWRLRRKKKRMMKTLAKKLVMVDDVMLIHTDEMI